MKASGTEAGRLARDALLLVVVFLAIALPRWLVAGQVATIDENRWVIRAANFAAALNQGDLADTYQSEHPGVPIMWVGALGLNILFPGYGAEHPDQFSIEDDDYAFDAFLEGHGYNLLEILVAGRKVMVLFNALALTLIFVYARRLFDLQTALLAAAFMALAPFLVAHTHLLHLDGLSGSLMVLSLVAYLAYAEGRHKVDLLLSSAAAGLAWLTKTPAFVLGPILFTITLLLIWRKRSAPRPALHDFLTWVGIGLITFILFWPAMWVAPLQTLGSILREAFGYAGGGHGDPVFFNGVIYEDGRIPARIFYFYPLTYLWRSTPLILFGLALVIPALWRRWAPHDRRSVRDTVLALLLYTLIFALFMTLGSKKFDRYLIPVYPALYLVAAAGWAAAVQRITDSFEPKVTQNLASLLILGALVLGQFLAFAGVYPYPLSYYNPLLGGSRRAPKVMQIGWGEGLDQVGRYLSDKPESAEMTVASWYSSVLEHHFDGKVISIRYDLGPADYAVFYINQWQRNVPAELLEQFSARVPEHVVEINGLEYARIYDLRP